jgi:hypothetical protein
MTNAADRDAIKRAEVVNKTAREQELNDFRHIMQTPEGRRWMWRMLGVTGVFRTSFTGNSTTFFNEGMRNIGLILMTDLNEACPERYQQMMNEARRREETSNA